MGTLSTVEAPIIEARQIEKFYTQPDGGRVQVIAPTDLADYAAQIVAVLGPSGCGKSTLLRMLAGLSPASAGGVLWHGQPVQGKSPNVSIVFQSFALFPWLTVLENVEAPLEARGMRPIERHKRALRSRRQLETAIQWGRYAEIFDYDAATGKLTLTEV